MKVKITNYWFVSIPVPFRLSWGKMGYSRHIFLELEDEAGATGYGEGILYHTTFLEFLPYFKSNIGTRVFFETDSINNFLQFEPALVFALDTGIRDIEGKLESINKHSKITEEIFLDDEIERKIENFRKRNTTFIKLKVGDNVEQDKKNIEKINQHSAGKMKIKIDANRGYSFEEAKEMSYWGKENNVILIEEPIRGDFRQVSKLRRQVPIPVMLDESVQSIDDLQEAILHDSFDILNIKLTRLGGISNAQKYIDICKKNSKLVSLGCSEELDIGTNAILTLAKHVDNLYGVEGYGPDRLNMSIAGGEQLSDSLEKLNGKNGLILYKNNQTTLPFMARELFGVWSTRLDNLFNLLIK